MGRHLSPVDPPEAGNTPMDGGGAAVRVADPSAGTGTEAVRGVLWSSLAWGSNRIVVFLLTLLLARLLLQEDFGIVTAGMTVIALLEVGLDLGVGSAVVFQQEQGITDRVRSAFTLNLVASGLISLACIAAAPAVARFFGAPDVTLFQVLFTYPLLRGAGQVQDAVLKRDLQFKKRVWVDLLRAGTRVAVSLPLALAGFGAWSIVWGLLASELAGTLANWFLVRIWPRLALDRATVSSLLTFGIALVAARAVGTVQADSDNLVVGNALGLQALGYYGVAYRLPELLLDNLYWVFTSVSFPVFAKAREHGIGALRQSSLRALMLLTLFGFSVGTGLAVVAPNAVLVLFSAAWAPSAGPMALISLAMATSAVIPACTDVLPAMGRPGLLVPLQVPFVVLAIIGFIVVADSGIMAVAAVHLVYGVLYAVMHLIVAQRLLAARPRDLLAALRPGFCSAIGIAALALPVTLSLAPGLLALVLSVLAGIAGAVAGLALGSRGTLSDVWGILRRALSR